MFYFNYHLSAFLISFAFENGNINIARFHTIYLIEAYISKKNILSLNLIYELSVSLVFCAKECVNIISHAACECRDTHIEQLLFICIFTLTTKLYDTD